MKKELDIYTELNDVVTSLKEPIAITSISEAGGISTIETRTIRIFDNLSITQDLTDGMIITINDINYQVSNVIHTPIVDTFDIEATGLTATQWNVACNFHTGTRKEINQILEQESGNLDRFPLLWLLPATDLDYFNEVHDFTVSVVLSFAYKSEKTYRTTKSIQINITPILRPLISLFKKWLQSSDFNYMLEFLGYEKPIECNESPFAFYGTSNEEVLNVTAAAIETNMDLTFKKQYIY